MFLGPACVGKTALFEWYSWGVYNKDWLKPTISCGIFIKDFDLGWEKAKLELWDTAG